MALYDESRLIESCKNGDARAFGQLYDAYVQKIYRFVYYKTYHKETAEDLTSVVFTKALENIGRFDVTGSFQAWLYTIARNAVTDHYRTQKKYIDIDDVWDIADGKDMEIDIANRRQLEEVQKYLQALPSKQRDIVIMRVWQSMSYTEIAQALKTTESSCKMAFSRAIHKLRKDMPLALLLIMLRAAS